MTAKMSGRRDGRIELSQRVWTLPDGSPAGWWSLAPGRDPGGDRHAREAARQIPVEHRETAWLRDDHGRTWWALLDGRTDRAAYASTRDELPADVAPVDVEPTTEPVDPAAESTTGEPEPAPVEDALAVEPVDVVAEPTTVPEPTTEPAPEGREEPTMSTIEQTIVSTLRGFGVNAEVAEVQQGAAVDRYALTLAPGTKTSAVTSLSQDLALAIGAQGVRVVAPIPGTKYVGIEVPAAERQVIPLDALANNLPTDTPLRIPVGLAVDGSGVSADLGRLPHLLIAGTTGAGKSQWLTSILAHLATTASPAEVQMMLIDPKRVELAAFSGIRHLAAPVATDTTAAIELLDAAVVEMESRYSEMERKGVRNVSELTDPPPFLVVAVEEMSDLMMTAGKRAEASIVRLLQVGRASGVHLILATQRPSADVVTGLIRANTPSRLVFAVQSHHDSKIALGQSGAEALLGAGDALFLASGRGSPERVQGPHLSTANLDAMLAPLKVEIDGATPTDDMRGEPCGRLGRPGETHQCVCERSEDHPGMHQCPCGSGWTMPPPIGAEPVEAAPEDVPAPEPAAVEPTTALPTYQPMPSEPTYTRAHVERAFQWGREYAETEAAATMTTRALRQKDWWAAAGVAALALLASLVLWLVLPVAAVVWAVWLTLDRRRRDLTPQRYPKRQHIESSR